ncbi:MAG: glycosyltransferase [Chlorobium sp.]|nr:glycosyltransferase [Chlorobium sp.]
MGISRQIRILQVVQSLDFGGLERVVINIVRNLDPSLFQCDVLCLRQAGRFADELQSAGHLVHSFGIGRGKAFAVPRKLASFIHDGGYDIVQTHDTTPLLYTAIAKLYYSNFQHVYTEHSGIYSCLPRHRFMTWLALLSTDYAVMVSKNLLSYYQNHFPLTKPEMSVIYNGLDFPAAPVNARESVCDEFGISQDAIIVGTAVRFYPQKGIRYLIKAIPIVLKVYPATRFLLVGDGVERPMLEQMVEAAGIKEHVVFAGFRRDVARLVGAMDIYVLPSLWEGLPLALIEALIAKKAVVATSVGGNEEMIENGRTGYIVPPKKSDLLADRLVLLVGSKKLRSEFAENGSVYVKEHFTLAKMVESYERLYSRMSGRSN